MLFIKCQLITNRHMWSNHDGQVVHMIMVIHEWQLNHVHNLNVVLERHRIELMELNVQMLVQHDDEQKQLVLYGQLVHDVQLVQHVGQLVDDGQLVHDGQLVQHDG